MNTLPRKGAVAPTSNVNGKRKKWIETFPKLYKMIWTSSRTPPGAKSERVVMQVSVSEEEVWV